VQRRAARAHHLRELLQAVAAGDHVHHVAPNLHDQLLRDDHPQAQPRAERVHAQVAVPVEPHAGDALVHLDQETQRVQRHHPRQQQRHDPWPPS